RGSADVEGAAHALYCSAAYGAEEVGLGLDRGRGGSLGKVEEGTQGPERVGKAHECTPVENPADGASVGVPVHAAADLLAGEGGRLNAQEASKRHGAEEQQRGFSCDVSLVLAHCRAGKRVCHITGERGQVAAIRRVPGARLGRFPTVRPGGSTT